MKGDVGQSKWNQAKTSKVSPRGATHDKLTSTLSYENRYELRLGEQSLDIQTQHFY